MEKSTRHTKKINLRSAAVLALVALLVGSMLTMLVGCHSKNRQDARVEARTKARTEDRVEDRRD